MGDKFRPQDHLIKLKGDKEYLEVKWRLVWFRQECPDGLVTTQLINDDTEHDRAVFKAAVSRVVGDGLATATAHGSETKADFADYLEKAETKAIGRALAALGYGTQFTDESEFDEGKERIVDAPIDQKKTTKKAAAAKPAETKTKKAAVTNPKDEAVRQQIRMLCKTLGWGKDQLAKHVQATYQKEVAQLTAEERVRLAEKLAGLIAAMTESGIKTKKEEHDNAQ